MKATSRLRRMDFQARRLTLSVRVENGPRLAAETSCAAGTNDSFTFMSLLDVLWERLAQEFGKQRLKKVSVTLSALEDEETATAQGYLFAQPKPLSAANQSPHSAQTTQQQKYNQLSGAIDALNKKYGRDTVSLGMTSGQQQNRDTGTKIAFTRIPDMEEFSE